MIDFHLEVNPLERDTDLLVEAELRPIQITYDAVSGQCNEHSLQCQHLDHGWEYGLQIASICELLLMFGMPTCVYIRTCTTPTHVGTVFQNLS